MVPAGHAPAGQVKGGHPVHQHRDVAVVRQDGTGGLGDFGGRQPRRRNLVEQGLEQVVILGVHQRHRGAGMLEGLAEGKPAKAGAEDEDLFGVIRWHTL